MDFSDWYRRVNAIKKNSVVVSPVGGKGSRMLPPEVVRGVKAYTIKALIKLGDETLIERFIKEYRSAGIRKFVFLLGNGAEEIKNYLDSHPIEGVSINYSYDPPVKKVGKGKALKHAVDKGIVPDKGYMYFGFPDDLILYPYWIDEATGRFSYYEKVYDAVGLVVFVKKITSPYGTAKIEDGLVRQFTEKPKIEMPVSTGRGIFNLKKLLPYLELIDMNSPDSVEFESVVLPEIAKEGRLAAYMLPEDAWISINTLKELRRAEEALFKV